MIKLGKVHLEKIKKNCRDCGKEIIVYPDTAICGDCLTKAIDAFIGSGKWEAYCETCDEFCGAHIGREAPADELMDNTGCPNGHGKGFPNVIWKRVR